MIINDKFISVNKYEAADSNKDVVMIFTHGLAEYSKSYIDTANFFISKNINVITYDLRGHGKSFGKRGNINSYWDYVDDLHEIVMQSKKEFKKVFLVGHSMGGVITNIYTSKYNNVDGVIISASPTDYLERMSFLKFIPGFLVNNKKLRTNFDDPKLSTTYKYQKDAFDLDFIHLRVPKEVLIKGMKYLKNNFKNYTTPVLFIYSKKDALVSVNHGENGYKQVASKDKELILYDNSNHNLFVDTEKEQIQTDVLKWLTARL